MSDATNTTYPTAFDPLPEIGPNDKQNQTGLEHDVVHDRANAILNALQLLVGYGEDPNPLSVLGRLLAAEEAGNGTTTMGACFVVDAGSDAAGTKVAVRTNSGGVITSATLLGAPGETGSATVDVLRASFSGYSGGASSICGGNKISIASGSKAEDLGLDGWTVGFSPGDVFVFVLDDSTAFTGLTLSLGVTTT